MTQSMQAAQLLQNTVAARCGVSLDLNQALAIVRVIQAKPMPRKKRQVLQRRFDWLKTKNEGIYDPRAAAEMGALEWVLFNHPADEDFA